MPLNKSSTYHQSVQFFVQFFSKKIVFLLSKKNFFLNFFFTQFYLRSTQFYHILLSFTSSGTQFYQIPPVLTTRTDPNNAALHSEPPTCCTAQRQPPFGGFSLQNGRNEAANHTVWQGNGQHSLK